MANGRWLCLLFSNTVENYRLTEPHDFFTDFRPWLDWSQRHGIVGEEQADSLLAWAGRHPDRAESALAEAKAFRRSVFRLFSGRAQGNLPTSADLAFLHTALPKALEHLRLLAHGQKTAWRFEALHAHEALLWPLALSASELLTSPDCDRLRQCHGDHCTWLFIDQSKNRSRRWCDMAVCGNRAKSKRHYQRTRQAAS